MDPLLFDNAVYEDVKPKCSRERFDIHENECYIEKLPLQQ